MSVPKAGGLLARFGSRPRLGWSRVGVGFAVMASAFRSAWALGIIRLARRGLRRVAGVGGGRRELRARNGPHVHGGAQGVGQEAFTAESGEGGPAVGPVRSPVPSDADLWPGELPFTAWGQHEAGTLDLRVFDQGQWWVDRQQTPHLVTDMSVVHVERVIDMLEALAEYYYLMTVRRDVIQRLGDAMLGRISTDAVADLAGVTPSRDLTPEAWLEGSPLMRALRSRLVSPPDGSSG